MKRKKVVKNLKNCRDIVNNYYHGFSNAQTDEIVANLQIALNEAMKAVKENKKLKKENEALKNKVKSLEYELEYGDPDGYIM